MMFVPFHLSSHSTSTVAESYKQVNKTIGNKTVLEEGYYYLNNFNHILSSFGEDWDSFHKSNILCFVLVWVHKVILSFYRIKSLKHIFAFRILCFP